MVSFLRIVLRERSEAKRSACKKKGSKLHYHEQEKSRLSITAAPADPFTSNLRRRYLSSFAIENKGEDFKCRFFLTLMRFAPPRIFSGAIFNFNLMVKNHPLQIIVGLNGAYDAVIVLPSEATRTLAKAHCRPPSKTPRNITSTKCAHGRPRQETTRESSLVSNSPYMPPCGGRNQGYLSLNFSPEGRPPHH